VTDVHKLLRRADRGPEHAKESRKLRAAMPPTPRASFDPGFTDDRTPGDMLEVSLAAGVDIALVPLAIDPREWGADLRHLKHVRALCATPTAYHDGSGPITRVVFWIIGFFRGR
jgi:hypothetical protein